jgi:fructose-1,6-bisphosphatase/inositol monophosphatase family enzyme
VIDKVEALVREVAASVVLPRFRLLAEHEIQEKGPGDLVTIADREAEALLTSGLLALRPGSRVVGEEATSADPSLLGMVGGPGEVWLVDPVDGTSNFAAGKEPFAVMVALLRDGVTVACCILNPVSGVAAVAERGAGAYIGGERVTAPTTPRPPERLRGPATGRYTPEAVRKVMRASAIGEVMAGHNCAGYEYPALLLDRQQFVFFWRTLPWDHSPGVLLVEEAGGVAWRLDGTPYIPGDLRAGLLVAQNQSVWDDVRAALFPHEIQ